MAVENGLRISSENMTGSDFDRLVEDLKGVGAATEDVSRRAQVFGDRLSGVQTELRDVALDAGAFVDTLGLVGQSFVRGTGQIEGYRSWLIALEGSASVAGAKLASLTESIRLSDVSDGGVEQVADQFRTVAIEADLANRSVVSFGDVLQEAFYSSDTLRGSSPLSSGEQVGSLYSLGVGMDSIRNFRLELVDLNATVSEAESGFRNITDITELEGATQMLLSALEDVTRVSREEIASQIAVEEAALMRLSNQERAESEHASKLRGLAVELRQLEVDYEQEKTRITREEVEKRTEFSERAAELRIGYVRREAEARLKTHQEVFGEIARTLQEMDDVRLRDRTYGIFGGLLTQGVVPREAFDQAQDFITLTDGMEDSIQRLETSIYVFSAIFRREWTKSLQSGVEILEEFRRRVQVPRLAALAEEVRGADVILRLEDRQSARDQRIADRFAAGADSFRVAEERENARALSFFGSLPAEVQRSLDLYREQRAIELGTDLPEPLSQLPTFSDKFAVGAGDLVAAVPLDVVDAITDIVQVRRDANAEVVQLEQEAAAEIRIIQESVTLSAVNKAKAIERVERQSALERIRIENEVSQRQRASFQSVVTNFLSGVARMIAAEAQLALARRATNALGGLFSGGVSGAAGLFSSVLLPLFGGLTLAYGASKLIAPSSPSADVYERSQYGVSGEGTGRNVQQTSGLTRASRESDTHVVEANINVNVEASGTRIGQANARERLKTERWGG